MEQYFKIFLSVLLALSLSACSPKNKVDGGDDPDTPEEPVEMNFIDLVDRIIDDYNDDGKISRVFIVAHRANTYEGYLNSVPDNSIPNIELAIKHGADMVELDVRLTKDNELVIMHNATIDATTTGTGNVSSLTLEQIKSFDMKKGSKVYRDKNGQTTKVPTLKEALLACKDKIYVTLDLGKQTLPTGKLIRIIQECGMQGQVVLYVGGSSSMAMEYQHTDVNVAIHPFITDPKNVATYSSMPGAVLFQYGNDVYMNNTIPEFGNKIHQLGYASYSNLLDNYDKSIRENNFSPLDKFIASGSDFVSTDMCELVDDYLARKGLRKEISDPGHTDDPDDDPQTDLVEGQVKGAAPTDKVWSDGARIGVFTDSDNNLPYTLKSGAGSSTGVFEGEATKDAVVFGAYYPYSESAGDDMSEVLFTIPATLASGESPAEFAIAKYADEKLSFNDVLSLLKVKLSNTTGSSFGDRKIVSVTVVCARNVVGSLSADVSTGAAKLEGGSNTVRVEVANGGFTDGIIAEASVFGTGIKGGDRITVNVALDNGVTLSREVLAGKGGTAGKEYVLELDASEFEPKIEVKWGYGGAGKLEKFQGQTPAIDGDGNVYFTSTGSTKLTKLSPDGQLLWSNDIGFTGGQNTHPAVEQDGSVIYATGGSGGKGAMRAFNADGTTKWSFTPDMFFGGVTTPAPNFNVAIPAVGPANVYIGNAGQAGTVLTIDKATGKRVSYVSNNGEGNPPGGVYSGVNITKHGHVVWFSNYGMYTANQTLMDKPQASHPTYGGYAPWAQRIGYSTTWSYSASGVACSNIGDRDIIACVGIENTTTGKCNMHVIAAEAVDGTSSPTVSGEAGFLFDYKISGVPTQDVGGICVGAHGEFIVSLKGEPASICAVNTAGSLDYKCEFEGCKDIAGCCAVDNNGYVHVLTDSPATYFIVEPDYTGHTCRIVAQADLYRTAVAAGIGVGTATNCRAWASPIIGDDGRMYAAVEFHKNWSERYGMLLCLSYINVTGYCKTSGWPMKGGGPRHDGNQK